MLHFFYVASMFVLLTVAGRTTTFESPPAMTHEGSSFIWVNQKHSVWAWERFTTKPRFHICGRCSSNTGISQRFILPFPFLLDSAVGWYYNTFHSCPPQLFSTITVPGWLTISCLSILNLRSQRMTVLEPAIMFPTVSGAFRCCLLWHCPAPLDLVPNDRPPAGPVLQAEWGTSPTNLTVQEGIFASEKIVV